MRQYFVQKKKKHGGKSGDGILLCPERNLVGNIVRLGAQPALVLLVFDAQPGGKSVGDGRMPSEHDKGVISSKFDHAFWAFLDSFPALPCSSA